MSTKELNATTLTTTMTTATTLTSSTKLDVEAEDDEEPPTTFEALDMDLVNGPNPWLPAYGFQLQHRSHFQPTHEDLRTNGSYCCYFTFYHSLNFKQYTNLNCDHLFSITSTKMYNIIFSQIQIKLRY